uniref:Uncharacterized protein n=1 Tax=Arundo donax TaxID=35708 RepID=A0A0A8ZEB9_ARUDO
MNALMVLPPISGNALSETLLFFSVEPYTILIF